MQRRVVLRDGAGETCGELGHFAQPLETRFATLVEVRLDRLYLFTIQRPKNVGFEEFVYGVVLNDSTRRRVA